MKRGNTDCRRFKKRRDWIKQSLKLTVKIIFFDAAIGILGDPGIDSGGEGKSKRAEKYGMKKSKERREESQGTMSYQTSSKRSPPFCLLIGQKNIKFFWHQSEARTAATVWIRFSLAPTICPWISEDER